jgi:chitin disaccharide deacetylase
VSERLLIVNADDLGLTPGVNRGIVAAHRDGVVTSASMLAIAPAFDDAVALLGSGDAGALAVGAHLAAVGEDPPLLSAREIPTLVDRRGRLALSWRRFLPRLTARRIDPADLRAEFTAQLERLRSTGIPLTHVDTHQHLHLHPTVAAVVVEVARREGLGALRVPDSARRGAKGRAIHGLCRRLAATAEDAGCRHPDHFAGLDEAGRLDGDLLGAVIARLGRTGDGPAEIGCHPGLADDPPRVRYRWGYRWAAELEGLRRPGRVDDVRRAGFRLGTFADL